MVTIIYPYFIREGYAEGCAIKGEQGGKRVKVENERGDGHGCRKCLKCEGRGHYATTCTNLKT
jgi:hypothetical protein